MPIEEIPQGINAEEIPKRRIKDRQQPTPTRGKDSPLPPKPADRVELSEKAKDLYRTQSLVNIGKAVLERLPDIRQEKAEEARAKIREGFYSGKEILSVAAERLLNMLVPE